MPKSHKRKNPGVGVDFKRAKYKVGKSLPKAQNETDVNFKSRSITLPQQGLAHQRGGEAALTSRQLSLKEVLAHCTHYSEKVRRDALTGLLELQRNHPQECAKHLATIMDRVAERLGDSSPSVRVALKSVLAQGILPAYQPEALGAYLPLLLVHLRVALTSAGQSVRMDALEVLEMLTEKMPQQVLAKHSAQVLEQYTEAFEGVQMVQGAELHLHKGLLQVLHRLHRYLQILLQAETQADELNSGAAVQPVSGGARSLWAMSCRSSSARQQALFDSALALLERFSAPQGVPLALVAHAGVEPVLQHRLPLQSSNAAAPSKGNMPKTAVGGAGGSALQEGAGHLLEGPGNVLGVPLAAATARVNAKLLTCWSRCTPASLSCAEGDLAATQAMLLVLQSADTLRSLAVTWLGGEEAGARAVGVVAWRDAVGKFVPVSVRAGAPGALQQALGRLNKTAKSLLR